MSEDGCGTVTFITTNQDMGSHFIDQSAGALPKTFTVVGVTPVLSVSTACGLTYTEVIKLNGVVTTDYDKTNDVLYGAVYNDKGTLRQTMTVYTNS